MPQNMNTEYVNLRNSNQIVHSSPTIIHLPPLVPSITIKKGRKTLYELVILAKIRLNKLEEETRRHARMNEFGDCHEVAIKC